MMIVWQLPQNQNVKLIIYEVYIYSSKYNKAVKSHSYHDYVQTNDLRNELLIGTFCKGTRILQLFKKIARPY